MFNFRTVFLRSWQKDGPPEQYWITAFFEPGDFLISIRYIASLRCGRPFHEMVLQCRFDADSEEPLDEENKVIGCFSLKSKALSKAESKRTAAQVSNFPAFSS